jgi:hypothetical protein
MQCGTLNVTDGTLSAAITLFGPIRRGRVSCGSRQRRARHRHHLPTPVVTAALAAPRHRPVLREAQAHGRGADIGQVDDIAVRPEALDRLAVEQCRGVLELIVLSRGADNRQLAGAAASQCPIPPPACTASRPV